MNPLDFVKAMVGMTVDFKGGRYIIRSMEGTDLKMCNKNNGDNITVSVQDFLEVANKQMLGF